MSDDEHNRDESDYPLGVADDSNVVGDYNMEIVAGKNSMLTKARPVPVFGMRHTSWQGADPNHIAPKARSKKLTKTEVLEQILCHALDTQGMISELKRIMMVGGLAYTPENIKKLVDSEKGNCEVLLRALGDTGSALQLGDMKSVALQIINNVTMNVDRGFVRASERMREDPAIEANVTAIQTIEAPKPEVFPNEVPAQTDDLEQFVMAKRGQ